MRRPGAPLTSSSSAASIAASDLASSLSSSAPSSRPWMTGTGGAAFARWILAIARQPPPTMLKSAPGTTSGSSSRSTASIRLRAVLAPLLLDELDHAQRPERQADPPLADPLAADLGDLGGCRRRGRRRARSARARPRSRPSAAKRASSSPERMRTVSPEAASRRARNASPLPALRIASVASSSISPTSIARAIAAKRSRRGDHVVHRLLAEVPVGVERGTEPAQRLLVEAREGRAAQPIVDDEPHRVRAEIDDGDVGVVARGGGEGGGARRPGRWLGRWLGRWPDRWPDRRPGR